MDILRKWKERREENRLRQLSRYTPTVTEFRGKPLAIVDTRTYRGGVHEIFTEGIYEFKAGKPDPYILDCGANIGLSVLYFKMLYPAARILVFEPDPQIFKALQTNVATFGLSQVDLRQAAVWVENGAIDFKVEGGFSGRIQQGVAGTVRVPACRLRDVLCENVEFLKLDIEGAEMEVVRDCADRLDRVERMFVEYHSESGRPQQLDELLAILRRAGFRYQVHEAYVAPKPFLGRPLMVNMDLQLNIFCFRDVTA